MFGSAGPEKDAGFGSYGVEENASESRQYTSDRTIATGFELGAMLRHCHTKRILDKTSADDTCHAARHKDSQTATRLRCPSRAFHPSFATISDGFCSWVLFRNDASSTCRAPASSNVPACLPWNFLCSLTGDVLQCRNLFRTRLSERTSRRPKYKRVYHLKTPASRTWTFEASGERTLCGCDPLETLRSPTPGALTSRGDVRFRLAATPRHQQPREAGGGCWAGGRPSS